MKSIPSSGIVDVLFAPCSPVFPSLFDFYPHPSFTWYQPGMLYPRETPSKCELSRMLSISRFDPRRGSSTLFFTVRIRAGPVPRLSRCRAIFVWVFRLDKDLEKPLFYRSKYSSRAEGFHCLGTSSRGGHAPY